MPAGFTAELSRYTSRVNYASVAGSSTGYAPTALVPQPNLPKGTLRRGATPNRYVHTTNDPNVFEPRALTCHPVYSTTGEEGWVCSYTGTGAGQGPDAVCHPACSFGQTCCQGGCTDLTSDAANCGACGSPCIFELRGGTVCCNGNCIDPLTDPDNCGGCGISCGTGACCNGTCCPQGTTCSNGICCPQGQSYCSGTCCALGNCCNGSCCARGETCCGNTCCPSGTCCINSRCTSVPSLTSISNSPNTCNSSQNTNYWLAATNCENVLELSVTLMVNGALSTENGFALQLNAVPPQNAQQINWMQYIFVIDGANINAWVEYWRADGGGNCMAFSNQFEVFVGPNPCCSDGNCCSFWDWITDNCNESIYYGLPNNSIPALYDLTISFTTDQSSGNVTAATFQGTDNNGNPFGTVVNIPTEVQVPIQSFQFVAVGKDDCASTTFSSAAPAGIVYNVPANTNQQLCIQGTSILCSGQANSFGGFTGESSNATYGAIGNCCGSQLSQLLMP